VSQIEITIEGDTHPTFHAIRNVFHSLWETIEVGASLCVYYENEKVIDLWAGHRDRARTLSWEADTLVNVYSASKGVASFAFACLVDEGKISYNDKVSDHWPEFGAEAKQDITVSQLLSHQAGLCGVDTKLEVSDLYHWEKMCNLLAAQKPYWQPGSASGYHAVTWGYFPGELIRRITGKSIGKYINEKISKPLEADFYLGLPDSELFRYSPLIGPNHMRRYVKSEAEKLAALARKKSPPAIQPKLTQVALMNPPISPFKDASSSAWRHAEIPASNGHGSARGLARIYAAMANGGHFNGLEICSEEVLALANKLEVENTKDLVLGTKIRRSRGFILNTDACYGPNRDSFGHAGAGGSMAFADPKRKLGFAYVMNQMQNDTHPHRYKRLIDAVYECLA